MEAAKAFGSNKRGALRRTDWRSPKHTTKGLRPAACREGVLVSSLRGYVATRERTLQFKGAIATVPARLSAASVSGCGARCERSVLAVDFGAL